MVIFPLLLALTGILGGIALSFIAPEELKAGRKYFQISKLGLFVILTGLVGYLFWTMHHFLALGIFAVLAILIFIINVKCKYKWVEIINYALFITPYFMIAPSDRLLIASAIFIYGLPTGTLLWNMNYEKN